MKYLYLFPVREGEYYGNRERRASNSQIAFLSKNKVLVRQLRQIFEHSYLRYRVERMSPKRLSIAPEEHQQIESMIRNKDYGEAERMMRKHIRAAKENMTLCLSREEEMPELSFLWGEEEGRIPRLGASAHPGSATVKNP